MKLLGFFELLLSVYLSSAFNLRGLGNDTLQQQLIMPETQEMEAVFYSRISNGLTAAPNQLHYQVGLRSQLQGGLFRTCGGSLISNEWLLTAAHCLKRSSMIYVYLGQLKLEHVQNVVRRPSPNVIEHDDYSQSKMLHDIALIRISPVTFTIAIRPVNLPFHPPRSYFHVTGTLAGWGVTSDSGSEPPSLQYATFEVISNADCAAEYGKKSMREGKLCASAPRPTNGCDGDSGGPLVVQGGIFQIGISSFGNPRGCELCSPLAFTRVDHYLDWIREKTNLGA